MTTNWIPNTDELFKPSDKDCRTTTVVKGLLKEIRNMLGASANYESIFGAVSKLSRSKEPDIFLDPFLEKLYERYPHPDGKEINYEAWREWITKIASMSDHYIQSVVYSLLSKTPTRDSSGNINGLGVLSDIVKKTKRVDIFTLNHDTLIEQQLKNFSDGFEQADWAKNGIGAFVESFQKKVRIYKLHGSISWFDAHKNIDSPRDDWNAYGLSHAITLKIGSLGLKQSMNKRRPNFITGTDKQMSYSTGIYGDLFYHQKRVFEKYDKIIFCGYGFGDFAINRRIESWLSADQDRKRKIILLDKGTLDNNEMIKRLCNLNSRQRVDKQYRWLSDCTADDLLAFVDY
jgi:hypothetical protein